LCKEHDENVKARYQDLVTKVKLQLGDRAKASEKEKTENIKKAKSAGLIQ